MLPETEDGVSSAVPDGMDAEDFKWLGASWESDAEATRTILAEVGPVDCLVVDHYAIDTRWESRVRTDCGRLVVIDDLANRAHACELLIDQNLGRRVSDYRDLVPPGCEVLVGPEFALLRPQFAELRSRTLARRDPFTLRRLLVSMGGTDAGNMTGKVLNFFKSEKSCNFLEIVVVLGRGAPWAEQIREIAHKLPMTVRVLVDVSDMATLISECDAAIGAAGSSSWERCCLGIPTLMVIAAENQIEAGAALSKQNAVRCANDAIELTVKLREFMDDCRDSPESIRQLGVASAAIIDGLGCGRVSEALGIDFFGDGMLGKLREICDSEVELMRQWRNQPGVRQNMYTTHEISSEEHALWWGKTKARSDCQYFMYQLGDGPEGVVSFTQIDRNNGTAFWAFYAAPGARKGTGGRMEYLALQHAFEVLGLRKLSCEVLSFNTAVVKMHHKFGFEEEGRFRKHYKAADEWADVHRLALFADEWRKRAPEMFEKLSSMIRN